MLNPVLKTLGWSTARAPEPLLRFCAAALGETLLWVVPGRRRLIRSNLHHAFPDRPARWHRKTARACSRRLVETGLLSVATPYLDERRIRKIARVAPSFEAWARDRQSRPRPILFGTLHLALWESQSWFKLICPVPLPEFGIIFRPLDQPAADAYVKRSRERFGMRLLSRKEGFADAIRILRDRGCVGVLFDQNAGHQGVLDTLFGRVCSTTELPGLLAEKFGAELRTAYPRRTGFWRVELSSDPIPHDGTAPGMTFALNRWLETVLSRDDNLCASWLWAHDRWRHQDEPSRRFRLESKRDLLEDDLRRRGGPALPRKLRVWIRLPNWLGDVVLAMPLLRALRAGRPDAEITLLVHSRFAPLLARWKIADRIETLPARGPGYFPRFFRLRGRYPDVWVLFTQSWRGDIEARLAAAPQRFGIARPGRFRPLLTHAYRVPADFDERARHQFALWTEFLKNFGLEAPADFSPLEPPVDSRSGPIGLIPGSENNPEKRWPISHWKRLIASLPGRRFAIFGTAADAPIADAIARSARTRVENLAGKTDLAAFADQLRACRLLVANDTGGMHLANALGVPVIALFGPTNPARTGPIFSAPCRVLQPPGCPRTGGAPIESLAPEAVVAAVGA